MRETSCTARVVISSGLVLSRPDSRPFSFKRDAEWTSAVIKESCKLLLHADLRVHIFCKRQERANARGYCVAAASSELEMIETAEATKKTFVAPAEDTASPIVNICRTHRTHSAPPPLARIARRHVFVRSASLRYLTS